MDNNGSWANTKAGKALENRLNDEQIVNAFNRILDRLDTIDTAVEKLGSVLHEAPGMISMVADMADDTAREAGHQGIDIDERLRSALAIAEKLTAPAMVKKLDHLLGIIDQAPATVSMVADMADDAINEASANGVNIDERLRSALALAEKLTAPVMVEKLDQVINTVNQAPATISMLADMADDMAREADANGINFDERMRTILDLTEKLTSPQVAAQLTNALSMAHQSSGLIAMAADSVDDLMGMAINRGVDPQIFAQQLFEATTKLATLLGSEEMHAMMDSGIMDPKTLKIISAASEALVESQQAPPKKVGLFGMMREMKNSDMQRSLGFLSTFAQLFGKKLG